MEKSPEAFRTISEVAEEIDVPQHVLRFWESRFAQIRPMKRGGGRRYYRPDDVDLLRGVRHLLYGEGYTIRGVQRILRDEGASFVQNVWRTSAAPQSDGNDDDAIADAGRDRVEPDLSILVPAPRDAATDAADRSEPAIASSAAALQVPTLSPAIEDKLRSALGELAACRRLIDAVLSEDDVEDGNGRSARPAPLADLAAEG